MGFDGILNGMLLLKWPVYFGRLVGHVVKLDIF